MRRIIALVLLMVACVACAPSGPSKGYVKNKRFTPAHDDWIPPIYIPGHESCFSVGKSEDCSYTPGFFTPGYTVHHNDAWSLYLDNGTKHGWRGVTQSVYNECLVGQYCTTKGPESHG